MEKTRNISLRFDKDGDSNNNGYVYDFDSLDDHFGMITDINNLGLEFESSKELIGNRFIITKKSVGAKNLTFNINFKKYALYKEFVKLCRWSKYYITVNYGIPIEGKIQFFRRDYYIKKIDKSEKQGGLLKCPVELQPITFWYSFIQVNSLYLKSDSWIGYTLNDESDLPSEIYFTISGSFKNLYFEVYGDTFETKKLNITREFINSTLVYSSIDNDNYIKEIKGKVESDLMNLDNINFYDENIIKIPAGCEAKMRFKSDEITGNPPLIYIEIRRYLISV